MVLQIMTNPAIGRLTPSGLEETSDGNGVIGPFSTAIGGA